MEVSFQGGFGSREAIVKVPPTFEMTGQNIEDLRRKVADAAKRSNLAISIVQMKNS